MSEENKLLRSLYAKANPKGIVANPTKYKRSRRKPAPTMQLVCQECQTPFTVRLWLSKRKYCGAVCSNKNKHHANSTKVHRAVYNGIQLDSGAELAFAILLDHNNIKWTKNTTISFPFVDAKGKTRKYYPDFYLIEYDFWVEVKGKRYIRPDDHLRLAAVGSNIERIMSDNIKLPKCVGDL